MFDFDIFPESSYDDTSGEFSYDFDFEPIPIGTVLLTESGKVYSRIFSIEVGDEGQRIALALQEVANAGVFEPGYNPDNPKDYPPLPENHVRKGNKNTRGPYTNDQVNRFFKRTGLRKVATVYYDEEIDAFWIDIDTA